MRQIYRYTVNGKTSNALAPSIEALEALLAGQGLAASMIRRATADEVREFSCPALPAYRVISDDGTAYVTSMARGVKLADARAYFIGQRFEVTETTFRTVTAVEIA